ncbi:major facilitator superfamily domain-containing protein [Microdochium trichocladiopsis]|uniref:Major facilitator superfamily domain-containing protein n=1 Tax=Microdochium trichocladiopsis TaxID=1682393 RepID=A0A9P8Y030_9PEZI|nr:major facilitator superfamily domain-containing protein [Microdochium trichocladiopsis]KAH7026045.1 major facilitator superfamily domain-containing protein [Microdochium trichocladiopsis]
MTVPTHQDDPSAPSASSTHHVDWAPHHDSDSDSGADGPQSTRLLRDSDPPRIRRNNRTQHPDQGPEAAPWGPRLGPAMPSPSSKEVVGWRDLPQKKQLFVITMARLSEPLVQTSLQSYMFYQLKWFDPSQPDAVISGQAGVLHASFTAAQFLTAMVWGRVADSRRAGRKTVILIGLLGTFVSCLGFGFSTNFWQALMFRLLGGITNGNIGVLRTMISEVVREKNAAFMLSATIMTWLFLEETLDARADMPDYGIMLGNKLARCFSRARAFDIAYKPLHSRDFSSSTVSTDFQLSSVTPRDSLEDRLGQEADEAVVKGKRPRYTQRLPFRRIFTPNVVLTFVAHFFLAFHVGTFNSLYFVFLSTPVYDPKKDPDLAPKLPWRFTGGVGLKPSSVGLAMALVGAIGITMQLFLYPWLSSRFGTLRSWRMAMFLFPLAYITLPYLAVVPSTSAPPEPKTGAAVWMALTGILLIQVTGRTFALPAQAILVNNCTPHPSVLGSVHGLGQSASSLARTVGPILCGWLYGLGLERGVVGAVFWGVAGVAVCGLVVSFRVREGSGHEIWLEGDEESA